MPRESQSRTAHYPDGVAYQAYAYDHTWERSPRVKGTLRLRANPWSLTKMSKHCSNYRGSGPAPSSYALFLGTTNDPTIERARAVAESNLRGELARRVRNKQGGSLGVTIATTRQSIEMLASSQKQLISIFSAAERFYQTTRGKKRLKRFRRLISKGSEPTAGMVLAGFFGWAPLFEDFGAACKTIANPWPDKTFFSVKKSWRVGWRKRWKDASGFREGVSTWSATGHSTYSCGVTVSNPNLWVANKLGLVNPLAVAWDLVPWSFLVNMVSNMGQVVGSLTDFAGLALSDTSLTRKLETFESTTVRYQDPRPGAFSGASGTQYWLVRSRQTGVSPPSVALQLRFPDWGIGTAAISGALLLQQTHRLSRLIGL